LLLPAASSEIKIAPLASARFFRLPMNAITDPLLDQIRKLYGDENARGIVKALLSGVLSPSQEKPATALLTRREAASYVNNELGHPLSFSTLTKLCALGEGPPVARLWGRRPLYERTSLRAWVEMRGKRP
jgi:hypothetical protein